ncbi:hypothetical protein PMAYCL1PPCAC_17258, partial [Pristionchus mayeri]
CQSILSELPPHASSSSSIHSSCDSSRQCGQEDFFLFGLAGAQLFFQMFRDPQGCNFAHNLYPPFESFVIKGLFQYWCDGRTGTATALGCIEGQGYILINTTAYVGKQTIRCEGINDSIAVY